MSLFGGRLESWAPSDPVVGVCARPEGSCRYGGCTQGTRVSGPCREEEKWEGDPLCFGDLEEAVY